LDSSKYGAASMVDPVFHWIASPAALDGAMPIGWLDSQTLVEATDTQIFEVDVDDRTRFREGADPLGWTGEPIFSPDQRLVAFGSFRLPVRIVDVASGRESIVNGATQLGPDVDYVLAWSSDNRSPVASAARQVVDAQAIGYWNPIGLWVANADGSGLRKVMTGQIGLVSTEDTDAQRAADLSSWRRAFDGPSGSAGPS